MISVLLLGSVERGYARPVLYPSSWPLEEAQRLAVDALRTAWETENWTWDEDVEPALEKLGFTVPCWADGPVWDEG